MSTPSQPFPHAEGGRDEAHRARLAALRAEREGKRAFPDDAPILGLQPPLPKGLKRAE